MPVDFKFDPSSDWDRVIRNFELYCEGQAHSLNGRIALIEQQPDYANDQLAAIKRKQLEPLVAERDKWEERAVAAKGDGFFLADPTDPEYALRTQDLASLAIRNGRVMYSSEIEQYAAEANLEPSGE